MRRRLLALCAFLLCVPQAFAASYPMQLTNNSGSAITSVTFTPVNDKREAIGQAVEVTQRVDNKAKATFQREDATFLQLRFVTEKGTYLFPLVSYYEEQGTSAKLNRLKPDVPELEFFDDQNELRMRVYGENPAWGIKQVLGSIPYGPGVTTLATAEALGGLVKGKASGVRTGSLPWEGAEWKLTLTFAGETPDSVLQSVRMAYTFEGDEGMGNVIDSTLEEKGYVPFLRGMPKANGKDGAWLDYAAAGVPKAGLSPEEAEEKAYEAMEATFGDTWQANCWMVPAATLEALTAAMAEGRNADAVLGAADDTVMVYQTYTDHSTGLRQGQQPR